MVSHESFSGGVNQSGDCREPLVILFGKFLHGGQPILHGCGVLLRFGEVEPEPDVHPVHVHGIISDQLEHHFLLVPFADHLLDFSFPDIRELVGSGLGW